VHHPSNRVPRIPDDPALLETYAVVFQLIEGEPQATLDDTRVALFAQTRGSLPAADAGLRPTLRPQHVPPSRDHPSRIVDPQRRRRARHEQPGPEARIRVLPNGDGRFVLRGGAGVFFDKLVLGFPRRHDHSGRRSGCCSPGAHLRADRDLVEEIGST